MLKPVSEYGYRFRDWVFNEGVKNKYFDANKKDYYLKKYCPKKIEKTVIESKWERWLNDPDFVNSSLAKNIKYYIRQDCDDHDFIELELSYYLSENPKAVPILKNYMGMIRWDHLSLEGLKSFKTHLDKIFTVLDDVPQDKSKKKYDDYYEEEEDYYEEEEDYYGMDETECETYKIMDTLSYNDDAVFIIEKYLNKWNNDCWEGLSSNINAISIIEKNIDKLNERCWRNLSRNPNPYAISIIENNIDKLNEECWAELSSNRNAIQVLEKNMDKVNWSNLSGNQNAIHILENNKNNIIWGRLLENPSIFIDEYHIACRKYFNKYIVEEMMMSMFHPNNFQKFKDWGFEDEEE